MSRITPHFVSDSMTKPLYFVGLEGPRVVLESMALPLSLAWLANYRTSQGRPVLIVPPFAPGVSTLELSLALRFLGHRVHGMPQFMSLTRSPRAIRQLVIAEAGRLSERYGEPITLVGWCYGGAFTRMAAAAAPQKVRQVINLGAALEGRNYPRDFASVGRDALPVPSTVIYSRSDGLFDHHEVREPVGRPRTENIEIPSSHFGMGNHPMAVYIIAERLAQPIDEWRPFSWASLTARGATESTSEESAAATDSGVVSRPPATDSGRRD